MWQTVAENLIPLAVTVLTPVLMLLVNKGLNMMAKKWNLTAVLVYEDKVDALVLKGIKAAEHKSLAAIKKGGDKTPGEKKLDDTMKFVNAQLKALKLDEKAAKELAMLVEAKLFDGAKEKALPAS
jgi:hypothetical protein